ncbi:MAG TPA: Npun_F0813 family protein [Candidatus Obscuribacterales bacterium]
MFILKRQDVEISSVQHPKRDQQIPILTYQAQTFRLINVFGAHQGEEAKAFWRDLTDNRGKACVLLEEPDRYSIWGKIRLDQLANEVGSDTKIAPVTQACLLLLQTVAIEIEDLFGARQAGLFQKDLATMFQQKQFPQTNSPEAIKHLLTLDPLSTLQVPAWEEQHLITLLQELHRLGKQYFGNTSFAEGVRDILEDMPDADRNQFIDWLKQSNLGKLWR